MHTNDNGATAGSLDVFTDRQPWLNALLGNDIGSCVDALSVHPHLYKDNPGHTVTAKPAVAAVTTLYRGGQRPVRPAAGWAPAG